MTSWDLCFCNVIYNLYELAPRSPTGEVVSDYYYYCNWTMMIMKTLSEHLKEIYHYSELLVFKTVNWPGTNILVFPIYTVLLQLVEGSKYLKRIANFRKRKRTLFGESCILGSSSTLQKGFYLLKKLSLFCGWGKQVSQEDRKLQKEKKDIIWWVLLLGEFFYSAKGFPFVKKIVPILCEHLLDATFIDDRALSISPILNL